MDTQPNVKRNVAVSHRLDLIPQYVIIVDGVAIPGAKMLVYMRTLVAEGSFAPGADPRIVAALAVLGCATRLPDGSTLCESSQKDRLKQMLDIFESSYNALMLQHEAQNSQGGN